MTPETALLAAIAENPDDPDPQLVIADWLLAQGDARGELIVLDHHERTTGGIVDPVALERMLLLAAEYTFPCAREPDESMLPFIAADDGYEVTYGGHHYAVWWRRGDIYVRIDDGDIDSGVDYPNGFPDDVDEEPGYWTASETAATLAVLSDAIRAGTPLAELRLPCMREQLPVYEGGARRVYRLPPAFTKPRGIHRDRYGLAARDYHRWNALWRRLEVL